MRSLPLQDTVTGSVSPPLVGASQHPVNGREHLRQPTRTMAGRSHIGPHALLPEAVPDVHQQAFGLNRMS